MKKYGVIAAFVLLACVSSVSAMDKKEEKTLFTQTKEDIIKDTAKTVVKECFTMPVINKGKEILQKAVFPKYVAEKAKAAKIKKDTKEILVLATQINQLKLAGVDKKVVNALSVKLAKKIQDSSIVECPCKK